MEHYYSTLIVLGTVMILTPWIRGLCERRNVPALTGYIILGISLSFLDQYWTFSTPEFDATFQTLGQLGVVALLFKVGLQSHAKALLNKLPEATTIWLGDVLVSLLLVYAVARYGLDLSVESSLVAAFALAATSVAVSVALWEERKSIGTPGGQLLIDVAELDDLSSVILLAFLIALLPTFGNAEQSLLPILGSAAVWIGIKLVAFVAGCYLFAHYLEAPFTRFNRRWDSRYGFLVSVLGAGLAISALSGELGFSVAIGALFAGLAFSRDPEAVREKARFSYFYELFTPFFFIQIGLALDPHTLFSSITLGIALLAPALFGKILGVMLPALRFLNRRDAFVLSLSTVPRAEITLVIAYQSQLVSTEAVPAVLFGALIFVVVISCVITPVALRYWWPQNLSN